MQAYRINGLLIKVERCAADMYIVRNIPGVFDNQVAIGAIVHKGLAQKFLDSYAVKSSDKTLDILDVDFEEKLPEGIRYCCGCVYWNGKGCEAGDKGA